MSLAPPIAKRIPHPFEKHGRTFVDEYAWLQNKDDPEVIAYLEAENAYARAAMQHLAPLQERIYQELRGRIQEEDSSAPERRGEFLYYWRMEPGQQYRQFCRKQGSLVAPEELLLDENALAEGHAYCRVDLFEPSPDHTLLAYAVDTTGAYVYDLYVKDLRTGEVVDGPIPRVAWSVAWANDSRTLFYTVFDDAHRAYRLFRHTVGDDPAHDVLVYHEPDDAYTVEIERTRSGAFLLMTLQSHSTTEVHYLPADRPTDEFRVVHPRQHWMEYYVEHHEDRFLIRTNEDAENFKLMEAPVADPAKANWRLVVPHREDTLLSSVMAFRSHLVLVERFDGLRRLRISDPDGVSNVRYVPFPEPTYTVSLYEGNHEYNTDELRFEYSSLVTPRSTVDYNVVTGEWTVRKQQVIPSGYDPTRYESRRLFATAPDGAQVPISLVFRKDDSAEGITLDGSRPLLLYAYGAYGASTDPGFNSDRLSLLDRGFVFAIAHVRGGSEMGRRWYEQGRLMHKKNTFTDFIACAEHLIAQGYTSPRRLAIRGRSAGGLLMGAVTNLRPDLFRAVVAEVPFTNVITAMLMPELPLTVVEWEQWGHPDDPQAFDYMLSYSPYENVTAQAYPAILAKAGLNDLQVPYWDPAKWVAKLRAHKTDDLPLLLLTNMQSGHSGHSGRYDRLREEAEVYAFIVDAVGAPWEPW
ncbi:MAG: S9 family peptidase [Caldilineales bacterium]|nr:S9 family peptidase [Caldilineales bacterium]MDW8316662.1 S9 family peptidase [Anaerolineae bacterium]